MKRKIIFAVAGVLFLLNFLVMAPSPLKAQNQELLLPSEQGTCKWSGEECSNGTFRELCLKDGYGNECTCGDVTRSC